jgi:succinate dehydrogenase / fumarate reductase cytochrome b subunit
MPSKICPVIGGRLQPWYRECIASAGPFIIWMFDNSISSEISFAKFKSAFNVGMLGLPGIVWKLVALALIWAYLHHFIAGLRHLWMDISHAAVSKEFGKSSAAFTLALSIGLTLILGAKLFGLY